MKKNLALCILSILLAAGGGLTIGLSDQYVFGAILIVAGFAGMFSSFYREYWRQVHEPN